MYYLLNNRFWTKILTDNNDLQHFKVNTEGKNIEKTRSFSLMHRHHAENYEVLTKGTCSLLTLGALTL